MAALLALLVGLLAGGGRPAEPLPGLPDAGALTGWGLPVTRLALDVAAVGTVGFLLTAAVLLPAGDAGLDARAARIVRRVRGWAAAWSLAALASALLSVSDTVGVPVTRLDADTLLEHAGSGRGRALVAVAVVTAAVAAAGSRVRTTGQARLLLGAALLALVPPTLTGHAASADDHALAVTALLVHVAAATVWIGGLLGIVLQLRSAGDVLGVVVRRFSALALVAFAAVGVTGVAGAALRLGSSSTAWASGYGALVVAKSAALVVLALFGWHHRRRSISGLLAGRPRAFLGFAAAELAVMAAVLGLAVALSRTPVPVSESAAAGHGNVHAPSAAAGAPDLLWTWQPDLVALLVLSVLLSAYLVGARSLAVAGVAWPRPATVSFAAGIAVAAYATCGGVAAYAQVSISAYLAQFLLLLLAAPALLVSGAPVRLWLRLRELQPSPADRPDPLARGLAHRAADPFVGAALAVGLVLAVSRTPLLEQSLRSDAVHLLVQAAALGFGALLLWPALGRDALPRPVTPPERALPLLAVAGVLAVLAAQLRFGDELLGGRWLLALPSLPVDPVADQRLAALVVAGGVALLLALALVVVRTAKAPALTR